jgi:hypothetical protein
VIHIQNGATVDALTSLPGETAQASALVESWATAGGVSPAITFFTASGGFRPNKDLDHPLNPMRGYMGETNQDVISEDDDEEDDSEEEQEEEAKPIDAATLDAEATRYDLVYVLDAAYHFPPSVSYFANSVLPVLKPGSGVLAYTDVLPPAKLSRFPLMLTAGWLAPLLNLPRENINERPASVDDYVAHLGRIGYENVRIEDWTEHVFAPLAANLEARGGLWWAYAQLIRLAERTGWKFVAVRGQRPQLSA